jgi:hypothetical protein
VRVCTERDVKVQHTEALPELGICPPPVIEIDGICQDSDPCDGQDRKGSVCCGDHFVGE